METKLIQTVDELIKSTEINYALPLGQRLLKAGFKEITVEQLAERFSCKAIEDRENKRLLNNIKELAKERFPGKEIFISDSWPGWIRVGKGDCFPFRIAHYEFIGSKKVRCVVKIESLDTYVHDVIPDRCTTLIEHAKKIGVSNFNVAYPVLEKVKQKDPIVVGILSENSMVEICQWE